MRSPAVYLTLMSGVVLSLPDEAFTQETGTGRMEIVFSDTAFSVSLNLPATEILGPENPSENSAAQTSIAVAISDLSEPLKLFVVADEAGCFTAVANVTLSAVGLGQANDTAQDLSGNQNDFQAEYQVRCQNIQAVETMRFAFFDRFPNVEKLLVDFNRSGHRSSHEVSRTAPDLSL
ncbi:ZrgA family zinc uptake protein [Ruegeria profundi]|uniref:ZrgA family zinc uptake protein n=1 Tax=Ruegeria profundi TaxID=1685378 RepID=UPI001CD56E73|nr:DUF2796 domain-containing protein [Ruegeria profundi]MCA0930158.1 DUF2796 domain-containing protein [Ruegeria profundi]